MTTLIVNLVLIILFFNLGAAQLHDSSQIIVNPTMPKRADDVVINQEAGGDISREIIYPIKKKNLSQQPEINAASSLVIDAKSGLVLFDKNSKAQLPIASITKLMTALVFLDQQAAQGEQLGWDQTAKFSGTDFRPGRRYLGVGEKVTIKDLFSSMLVGSANSAAAALARTTGLTKDEFVNKMNDKTSELKMKDSSFSDVTGLSENNIATARDLAKLVYIAMQNPEITAVLALPEYKFSPTNKKITHKVYNTNRLLKDNWLIEQNYNFIGGKTGYIDQSGYNFVAQITDDKDNSVISVILDTSTVDHRFSETKEIVKWSLESYDF